MRNELTRDQSGGGRNRDERLTRSPACCRAGQGGGGSVVSPGELEGPASKGQRSGSGQIVAHATRATLRGDGPSEVQIKDTTVDGEASRGGAETGERKRAGTDFGEQDRTR